MGRWHHIFCEGEWLVAEIHTEFLVLLEDGEVQLASQLASTEVVD